MPQVSWYLVQKCNKLYSILYPGICTVPLLTDLPEGHAIPIFGALAVHEVEEHAPTVPTQIIKEFKASKNRLICLQHQPIVCAPGAVVRVYIVVSFLIAQIEI